MNIYSCCGYCVCSNCFSHAGLNRCPFCRSMVSDTLRADTLPREESVQEPRTLCCYPERPSSMHDGINLIDATARFLTPTNDQLTNLTLGLHALVASGRKRILLVFEEDAYRSRASIVDIARLSRISGIELIEVDNLLTGAGSQFKKVKKRFDEPPLAPMGLICLGEDFLVGTNLDMADAMLTVGTLRHHIVTQAVHRLFRPRATRDNTQPIVMLKIFS